MRDINWTKRPWLTWTVIIGLLIIGPNLFVNQACAADTFTLTGNVTYPDISRVESGFISAIAYPYEGQPSPESLITDGKYSLELETGKNYSFWVASYRDISDGYENTVVMYFPPDIRTASLNVIVYRCQACFHQSADETYDPSGSLTRPYDRLGSWSLLASALSERTTLNIQSGFNLPRSVSSRIIDGTTLKITVKNGGDGTVTLNEPLRISLPIAKKRLSALHLQQADVLFAEYDRSTKKWTNLPTRIKATYPSSANDGVTLTAEVDHLGTFALVSLKKIVFETYTASRVASSGFVRVLNEVGKRVASFAPYGATYRGKFLVATGDINGDGTDEVVTLQTLLSRPTLKVFTEKGKLLSARLLPVTGHGTPDKLDVKDAYGNGRNDIVMKWEGSDPMTLTYAFFPNKIYDSSNSIPNSGKAPNVYGE